MTCTRLPPANCSPDVQKLLQERVASGAVKYQAMQVSQRLVEPMCTQLAAKLDVCVCLCLL